MTTEKFTKKAFEDTLTAILDGTGCSWKCAGLYGGEFRYAIDSSPHTVVMVNSSVMSDGYAADTADNSIRVWITDKAGNSLGSKTQKWVTRVPGWGERLAATLDTTLAVAKSLMLCNKCGTVEKVFIVKKEGPNKGRMFTKCECDGSFMWLDVDDEAKEIDSPKCPKCGQSMILRTRKSDGNKFWGCKLFPACKGTLNYTEGESPVATAVNEISKPVKSEIEWSQYQIEIFRHISSMKDSDNLVVEALAGTGKTTTIAQSTKLLPRDKKIVVVVFNKHNVAPVQAKVPNYVHVCTYHSLAFAACRKAWGDVKVNDKKVDMILESILDKSVYKALFPTIRQIVSLVKANLSGTSSEELEDIVSYYGIEVNGDAAMIFDAVARVIEISSSTTKVIDYDDMCWLPIVHSVVMEKYDYVYVDEAQDTNRNQIAIALSSVSETGHIIAVGDRHQSMYGFRGADANAIPNLIESLEAKVLPLSITYRNPQCVVDVVNNKFPEIPLEGTGKAGSISTISYELGLVKYAAGDMVLCRTNAPLVPPVFDLIRRGVKATIRGRDIGKGLLVLVKKMKVTDVTDLLRKLEEYKNNEVRKLLAADKNAQAQTISDKVDTIAALADGVNSIFDLENRINTIFSDEVEGVVFSTIHRAKGLEANNVFILQPELLPHPMAKKDWEKVQEKNIEYVALTRTLENLIYVDKKG
jgi:ribosomal protein S27AE